ncbi:hypothetical protein [Hansschlegelia zhihuaiae]|uniref:Uncharacterized protein n=1 Tax=Hansschlegelia zhihuaiae TaxID=405005 RepID=A0A4Q0MLP8_9HYPH|nr:hypothetical protein [Hansschlegelia zhihuaiae]RXF73986.1 hypothetical protein EK403_08445 [Hansschlegelia zhihuaiae]
MTEALPQPSDSEPSFARALTLWRDHQRREAPFPEAGERPYSPGSERTLSSYAPYAVALALALGAGAAFASLATAPALDDSIDTVAALDARTMGLARNLDSSGQQTKAATLNRDVSTMKSEIARLQRALDQARSNQAAQSKAVAGQAASNQEEVRSLKAEIANLQRTLETARDGASARIEQLSTKLDQSKEDAARVAELRERLDRMEKQASAQNAPAPAESRRDVGPEITGSLSQAPRGEEPRSLDARAQELDGRNLAAREPAQPEVASRDAGGQIIRNWTVREVYRGVALLEGRRGMIEVVRGARAPGIGRVRSIERRDGQWVVVTDRGLVLERQEL